MLMLGAHRYAEAFIRLYTDREKERISPCDVWSMSIENEEWSELLLETMS